MCQHDLCNEIRQLTNYTPARKYGIGILIVVPYFVKCNAIYKSKGNYLVVGKERRGKYKNQYNVVGGGLDAKDNGCFYNCAIREMEEEIGISFRSMASFDTKAIDKGKYRIFLQGRTPQIVLSWPGLKRSMIQKTIQ